MEKSDRREEHAMLTSTPGAQAAEAPSRVQLAIREWQRQLIAMTEAARRARETPPATAES
jgi:hypothetical protein